MKTSLLASEREYIRTGRRDCHVCGRPTWEVEADLGFPLGSSACHDALDAEIATDLEAIEAARADRG